MVDGSDDWVSIGEMNFANISVEAVFTSTNVNTTSQQYVVANVQNGGEQLYIKNGNIGFSAYINGAYQTGADMGISWKKYCNAI